jgi:hypothetical protein
MTASCILKSHTISGLGELHHYREDRSLQYIPSFTFIVTCVFVLRFQDLIDCYILFHLWKKAG